MSALAREHPVAVVGTGTMGQGIAQVAATFGHPVYLYDGREGAAEQAREAIGAALSRRVERGRLSAIERERIVDRLQPCRELVDLAASRLVIEAVVEDLDAKRALFGELESHVDTGTILASNTSSLSITAIGAALQRPSRLVGMHFFNPVPAMRLVEVISGLASEEAVLDCVAETARAWGKTAVRVRSSPGFIVNRVARPFYGEALRALDERACACQDYDAVMRDAGGFRMGPFELMDLIGHDVNFAVTRSVFEACFHDARYRPSLAQQALVEAGRLGRKSGWGFYRYGEDVAEPVPSEQATGPAPSEIVVQGDPGRLAALLERWDGAGIPVRREPGDGAIRIGRARLRASDGDIADLHQARRGGTVLVDLALDYSSCRRLAISAGNDDSAAADACGALRAIGIAASVFPAWPGLPVLRTLAMLANEALDLVYQGIASVEDIDRAMVDGLNYPRGPVDWARELGWPSVLATIDALDRYYRDGRYRASPLLRRLAASGPGPQTIT